MSLSLGVTESGTKSATTASSRPESSIRYAGRCDNHRSSVQLTRHWGADVAYRSRDAQQGDSACSNFKLYNIQEIGRVTIACTETHKEDVENTTMTQR